MLFAQVSGVFAQFGKYFFGSNAYRHIPVWVDFNVSDDTAENRRGMIGLADNYRNFYYRLAAIPPKKLIAGNTGVRGKFMYEALTI